MTTKNLLSGLVISSLLAGVTQGANIRYRQSGDWTQTAPLNTGSGWQSVSAQPGLSDEARINWGGNTVTVTTTTDTVNRVAIGVDESGTVEVQSGGILNVFQDLLAGNNNVAATGTLTVNNGGLVNVGRILWAANSSSTGFININPGGVVEVESHLWWGVTGNATITIAGTLNQNGGNLGLGTSNASTASGGAATVFVNSGGFLNLNQWSSTTSIQDGSVININGTGTVTVGGNRVSSANDYFALGKIAADTGEILATYDADLDLTTIIAIPEPGTVSLLGMVGVLGLLRRRRLR
jgi:hypothetical protein